MPRLVKQMTRDQVQYYVSRFRWVLPDTRIAEELGVTSTTWSRWANNEGRPSLAKIRDFRDLLRDLCKGIVREARGSRGWEARISDLMLEDPEPAWRAPAVHSANPDVLRDMLIEMTLDRKAKSGDILRAAFKAGFTRMQVYHMADRIGIMRDHKKFGRAGYSEWSLNPSKRTLRKKGWDA